MKIPVFVAPAPVAKVTQAELRAKSVAFRGRLLELLAEKGPSTAAQLAEVTGVKPQMIRDYMHRLINVHAVKSQKVVGPRKISCGTVMAVYSLIDDMTPLPAEPAKPPRMLPGDAPRRTFSNQYPPNRVRDPFALPAEFFGARAP